MRMKLLMAAAMVAALATPAIAEGDKELPPKRTVQPDKPEVKGDGKDDLPGREIFDLTDSGFLFQQQRVEQTGNRNYSDVDQTDSNQALASVIQRGRRNDSYVTQSDAPDLSSVFVFPSNIAVVSQTGNGNDSYIDQVGNAFEKPYANRADVHQVGDRNSADVHQKYNDRGLVVVSQGDDGTGNPHDVTGNYAYVSQVYSTNSEVFVTQTGDYNEAYVDQSYAYESKVALQQDSNYNYADIYQTGDYNDIHALQNGGDYNELYISQDGYGNFIAVEQDGEGNFADISQGYDVAYNGITLLQAGNYNVSFNSQ